MKGNLLVIDDEKILLNIMKANLRNIADEIFTAENGEEGLKILQQKSIHCIICDINMPNMNGVEVLKQIRERKFETPFIFFTSHGNEALMMEAVKYGAFDFLEKPLFDGLIEVTTQALEIGIKGESIEGDYLKDYHKLLKEHNSK